MSCPDPARLAAAVTRDDVAIAAHAAACVRCASVLAEQRELTAAARRLPAPTLTDARRRALAAEVMAQVDAEPVGPRWRGGAIAIAAAAVTAVAIVAIVLASSIRARAPQVDDIASEETPGTRVRVRVHEQVAPAAPRPAQLAGNAEFSRTPVGTRDIVELRDGALAIDARDSDPITIVAGDTSVRIAGSRAKVVARAGVIVTAHVFAGTAEVTRGGHREVIDAGEVWQAPAAAEPPPIERSLDAFRTGWQALREGRHADAIAAFDRARDEVVAEDAAFWAAIASERAGDRDDAARRLRAFVAAFPESPRVEDARAAIERVTR